MANRTVVVQSDYDSDNDGPYREARTGDDLVDGDGNPIGGAGTLDRYLVFSDDTEFAETDTSATTKKSFNIVVDSDKKPTKWRLIAQLWVEGENSDTAVCTLDIGGDSTTGNTTSTDDSNIEVIELELDGVSEDAIVAAAIKIHVSDGNDEAHIKYTDLYAVFE